MDKGNGDPVVLESGEENNSKGHLVCLREHGAIRAIFVDFNFINDKSPDPIKVNTVNFYSPFEGFFDALNGDFFNQPGEYDAVKVRSKRCQEKQYSAEDNKDFFILHRFFIIHRIFLISMLRRVILSGF